MFVSLDFESFKLVENPHPRTYFLVHVGSISFQVCLRKVYWKWCILKKRRRFVPEVNYGQGLRIESHSSRCAEFISCKRCGDYILNFFPSKWDFLTVRRHDWRYFLTSGMDVLLLSLQESRLSKKILRKNYTNHFHWMVSILFPNSGTRRMGG